MKRLIAKKITAYDGTIVQQVVRFLRECAESGNFNYDQMERIYYGFEYGLTIEQVKVYAKPEFNYEQMEEVRCGLRSGLTMEQVKLYADPKFDWKQMYYIRNDFEDGLTIEEVKEKYNL